MELITPRRSCDLTCLEYPDEPEERRAKSVKILLIEDNAADAQHTIEMVQQTKQLKPK